jgi:hypothetical protein
VTINKEVAVALRYRQRLYHKTQKKANGTPRECRVNGNTKTWKRRPEAFRVPVKEGLYQYSYITESNGGEWQTWDPSGPPPRMKLGETISGRPDGGTMTQGGFYTGD